MPSIVESDFKLLIQDKMAPGKRVLFGLLALIPLLAPYQLIILPDWESYFNFFFILALLISIGALLVSGLLIWATIAGLDSWMRFNKQDQTFTYAYSAPILPFRTFAYPLESVQKISVETHEWSDGEPSYSIKVYLLDGREHKTGSSWDKAEIEGTVERVNNYLDRS